MPDAIVIGGGVIGTTAAWQIAAAGAEVVLLERGALASGATGRSQGLVLPPDHEELVPLWRESVELYGGLADEREFAFDRTPIGTLLLATDESQLAALDDVPHAGERLDAAGVAEAEPGLAPGMAGGLLLAEGRRSDPGALAAAAAASARAAGAEIRAHVEVKRLVPGAWSPTPGGWTRRWSSSPPARGRAGWRGCSDTSSRYGRCAGGSRSSAPGPEMLRHAVYEAEYTAPEPPVAGGPVTLAGLGERRACRARRAGRPRPRHPPERRRHGARRGVAVGRAARGGGEPRALRGNAAPGLHAWCPGIAGREVAATWTGLRPFSPTGFPTSAALDDGTVVCAGHGSEGILTGAGSGRLAAELALGREPYTDPAPFRLDR